MRIACGLALLLWASPVINAVSIPDANAVAKLHAEPRAEVARDILLPENALEKRKGGGGKGGGGGGGGGSKSGGGSGSGSKSGGGGSGGKTSNTGGSTKAGSGPRPAYGGGAFYGGGARVPYAAGKKTPKGLLAGALILPAAALLIFPGLWLYSVYPYHYTQPYTFLNQTVQNATNGLNQTLPVTCLCEQYSVCGCDDNSDSTYLNELVGNGSYAALNKTLVTVAMVNDTRTLVINGTLPNGTTAPGGSDSAAAPLSLQLSGYWAMIAVVLSMVVLL